MSLHMHFFKSENMWCARSRCDLLFSAAILGVHTLVTSNQTYDGTGSKEGYNSEYNQSKTVYSLDLKV